MKSSNYNLSYIIATRNRLPFLKITLGKLLQEVLPDEEIVVVDGNSSDGTKEYLNDLIEQGKIHQYISERDKNQAHAWNKAMLLAKGVLIKKIIDDDVFCYTAIRECKDYMLTNKEVDACISNSLTVSLSNPEKVEENTRVPYFKEWKSGNVKSFTFSDVYLMIRKSTLSFIGLYDTKFRMLDWEYSLRISYLQTNIAYYTGFMAMGIDTPGNVTSETSKHTLMREGVIGKLLYEYAGDGSDISNWSKVKIAIGKSLDKIKKKGVNKENPIAELKNQESLYNSFYETLKKYEENSNAMFL